MGSKRLKKLLLAALIPVLVYIWWGNIALFLGSTGGEYYRPLAPRETATETIRTGHVQSAHLESARLEYREPLVNPFTSASIDDRRRDSTVVKRPRPEPSPLLGDSLRLRGVIPRGQSPQVIVADRSGATRIVSVGDTIIGWKLVEVGTDNATFKKDGRRETLRLSGGR